MISPLAYVHPDAKLGNNVTVEPFAYIAGDVEIGDDCWIGPGAVIHDGARIGKRNKIHTAASISCLPQDLKFVGEKTTAIIGDDNDIRECVTISRGTASRGTTVVGSHNLLMAYVHVAHDCIVGNNCVLANNATLAGHVTIGDYVILGGKTAILQFVTIGDHAITAGGSLVDKDVPPFIRAARYPISYAGINSIGLNRRGFTKESITIIQDVYRYIFQKGYSVSHAVELAKEEYGNTIEGKQIFEFVERANVGLLKGYSSK